MVCERPQNVLRPAAVANGWLSLEVIVGRSDHFRVPWLSVLSQRQSVTHPVYLEHNPPGLGEGLKVGRCQVINRSWCWKTVRCTHSTGTW